MARDDNTFVDRTRALLTGFATTFRYMFKPAVTVNYPEQKIPMTPKYPGQTGADER